MAIFPLRFVIMAFFALDLTRGEITNEIQEYVQNLLKEQTEEIRQLKKQVQAFKGEMFSLQQSYEGVMKELNIMKTQKKEPATMEYKMNEKVKTLPIHILPFQRSTPVKPPLNGFIQSHMSAEHVRKVRSSGAAPRVNTIATYPTAFSAIMSRSVSNIQHNQVLIFDETSINSGNAYDTTSGIFTPTIKGVYALFSTITTNPGKSLEAMIFRNGAGVRLLYSGDSSMYSAGSNMVILPLNIGDHVMVRIHGSLHETGVIIDGVFSSFSGYLLYETD